MRTHPENSDEAWIITLRAAATGSTATIFPETLGLTVCPVICRPATSVPHPQTVWTCVLPEFDLPLSLIQAPEWAGHRAG